MAKRYRTKLVVKLFPSVPKGIFGTGRLTSWLEKRLFYREFAFSPGKVILLSLGLATLAAWSVAALGLSWHALWRAEQTRRELEQRESDLQLARTDFNAARRDYHLLLSRLTPLNDKVDDLADFSRKLAIVAGIDALAEELGSTADQRRLDLELSGEEIAELDRRFARLGSYVANQELQLARTPSISPLKGGFVPTDRFGYRSLRLGHDARGGKHRGFHAGLDLAAPTGTPIHATADGSVHFAGSVPREQSPRVAYYGRFVVLDHGNGIRTVYAHCDRLAVESGQQVRRGDVIGWVGSSGRSTGPHLHYEVVVGGRPMDPELYILDVEIPKRRVRVEHGSPSLLIEEVDRLLGL